MSWHHWQKSSYCQEGDACVHISATHESVQVTESADPTQTVLTTTPITFSALLDTLKASK
ncbi:DUF397 domain-containing protein [Streptomyces sp. NL15-2K]|uniref:DUF397 domain-containing protein n=1 Tax=Streptomyces sp. NL15-2K TaxID=376149 RepID=UPI000F584FEC|nr:MULTISPECIES: DUF397 domain-containing protein [Actinomycetes]WKX10127.1 DUF397 domain-containing protein [Kutzneria buriramensis]GCB48382.1 hypothetical protein SNL152K_5706 [Streptomyces sp. NL15-2K]